MKNDLPLFALLISWFGTITSFIAEARELISLIAALGSLIATFYTITLTRRKLLALKRAQLAPIPTISEHQSQTPKPTTDHE